MSIGPWDPDSGMSTQPPPSPAKPPVKGMDRLPDETIKPPVKPEQD